MSTRHSSIKKKAKELLKKMDFKKAPISVEAIATDLGITLKYEPFDGDLSGMAYRDESGSTFIGINSIHPKVRKRFTIAHEIGHVLLHSKEKLHVDEQNPIAFRNPISSQASDPKEIEANQFAAELLMPESILVRDVKALPDDATIDEAIENLAEKYQVSIQAMTIRLTTLGLLSF